MGEGKAVSQAWTSCPACGYTNAQDETRCEKCGRRLWLAQRAAVGEPLLAGRQSPPAPKSRTEPLQPIRGPQLVPGRRKRPSPQASPRVRRPGRSLPQGMRKELSSRVQAFRSRRLNGSLPLQFDEEVTADHVVPFAESPAPAKTSASATSAAAVHRPYTPAVRRRSRPVPHPAQQPELDFPSPAEQNELFLGLPVAPFRLRLIGHAMDFLLTAAAFLFFLLPLKLAAGPVVLNRVLLAGAAAAYLLVALLYGIVFVCLAGATPSMKWLGLRVVSFDGLRPPRRQLLCRVLGTIASVGSFFLGFFWAAVDEEKLAWHDRISRTFLTVADRGKEGSSRSSHAYRTAGSPYPGNSNRRPSEPM